MARISKDPEERKNELLDAAEELFLTRGFEQTAVSDIVKKVGVAQGLFYYYFKSKDEIYNAVMERYLDGIVGSIGQIVNAKGINAPGKIQMIFKEIYNFSKDKEVLTEYVHREENLPSHFMFAAGMLKKLGPILEKLLEEGNAQGIFNVRYASDVTEILLAGLSSYLHDIIMVCDEGLYISKLRVVQDVLERVLGAEEGTFEFRL